MTIEETIRERHAFEDRVKTLLELVSIMTNREIEIALARLVDMLAAENNESKRSNIAAKGELLKSYYDLRRQGVKDQRSIKRQFAWRPHDPRFCLPNRKVGLFKKEPYSDYFIRCTSEVVLFTTPQIPPSTTPTQSSPIEMVKLLAP